ncbi:LysE family translocator [Shewanella sp. NIFS-20-20]|uniref:LysE family translocator n=1 Tax=Shewanella sp. NIFS-20-20 TaxID=2853806 RepID=UPI001C48AAE3|nr:LysE family translocator [Shewanella sp. NIFS-20-20]MBV7316646.1 LysE family translocator [Shewanella sp. NIFS-20-20]
MIDFALLPVYLTAVLALLLIPGPDMLLITSASITYGKRVGIFASLGNATAGLVLTLLAAIGVSSVIAMQPMALQLLKLLGGAYLLKMGWDCWHAQPSEASDELAATSNMAKQLYRRAVLSNLLNPKALMFFVLFLPQFVSVDISASSTQQLLALGLLLNVAGLSFNLLLVALIGNHGQKMLAKPKFRQYQNKVMGAVFIALALWLLGSQLPNV